MFNHQVPFSTLLIAFLFYIFYVAPYNIHSEGNTLPKRRDECTTQEKITEVREVYPCRLSENNGRHFTQSRSFAKLTTSEMRGVCLALPSFSDQQTVMLRLQHCQHTPAVTERHKTTKVYDRFGRYIQIWRGLEQHDVLSCCKELYGLSTGQIER